LKRISGLFCGFVLNKNGTTNENEKRADSREGTLQIDGVDSCT